MVGHRVALLHVAECPSCFRLLVKVVSEIAADELVREEASPALSERQVAHQLDAEADVVSEIFRNDAS